MNFFISLFTKKCFNNVVYCCLKSNIYYLVDLYGEIDISSSSFVFEYVQCSLFHVSGVIINEK